MAAGRTGMQINNSVCDCWLVVDKFQVEGAIMESATNESYLTILLWCRIGSPKVNVLVCTTCSLRVMFDTKK